ncbi:hypothetical protein N7455_010391 [Penicillium solitum]|uniref:uncharacterized protein n=1 Tax=Penicillium solitum TaxID=60172 RepID=UPI0032C44D5B|nr:hypothetical protein N7536_008538 [Penicillium majusculum]KAJ5850535.1 hypothetical protein N7455_010391 [Penicillium solitum]
MYAKQSKSHPASVQGPLPSLYLVPAPFPVTITLTLLGHKPNRPPSFLSPLPDFFFPSLSTHSSPFSKFSHTRGIRSLHIHLKTAVLYSIDLLRQARDYP